MSKYADPFEGNNVDQDFVPEKLKVRSFYIP